MLQALYTESNIITFSAVLVQFKRLRRQWEFWGAHLAPAHCDHRDSGALLQSRSCPPQAFDKPVEIALVEDLIQSRVKRMRLFAEPTL